MTEFGRTGEPALLPPILRVENATTGYGDLTVLSDVSLTAFEGELHAVLGQNGAGKTTLMSLIVGLLPFRQGELWVRELKMTATPVYRRARCGIALVQEGKRVFRSLSVAENVYIGARVGNNGRRSRLARVEEELTRFPALNGKFNHRVGNLSGGQQQMVAIAQALASNPKILLLDEPSAGLAPAVFDDILESICSLKPLGIAIVLVEQLVEEALRVADRVTVLERGSVALTSRVSELASEEAIVDAFFGRV